MTAKVYSCSFSGLDSHIIEVEADIANGMPAFNIVGLGDTSVQESKERIRSSIKNSGLKFLPIRKTINLAPAQLRKHGTLFDLPIAISLLIASGQLKTNSLDKSLLVGELALNGEVKAVRGAALFAQAAAEAGFEQIFLPVANAQEASLFNEIKVIPVSDLKTLIDHLNGKKIIEPTKKAEINFRQKPISFTQIIGLEKGKRALEIALAGCHHTLLYGSPGCGKTVLCRSFRALLPSMTKKEILESTKIFSIAGLLNDRNQFVKNRPFREVHHSASLSALIGGGAPARPGEITLAHNGILFLDEIAEFSKKNLEALRQPLEDRQVIISRNNSTSTFPADFTLLATMNPCPCGYSTDNKRRCICTQSQLTNYQKKLSGPLLDRFDLFVHISHTPIKKLTKPDHAGNQKIFENIQRARLIQHQRGIPNNRLQVEDLKKVCQISSSSQKLLFQAIEQLHLSNRAYIKILKIARTIADLDNDQKIKDHHLMEAIQFRKPKF